MDGVFLVGKCSNQTQHGTVGACMRGWVTVQSFNASRVLVLASESTRGLSGVSLAMNRSVRTTLGGRHTAAVPRPSGPETHVYLANLVTDAQRLVEDAADYV